MNKHTNVVRIKVEAKKIDDFGRTIDEERRSDLLNDLSNRLHDQIRENWQAADKCIIIEIVQFVPDHDRTGDCLRIGDRIC